MRTLAVFFLMLTEALAEPTLPVKMGAVSIPAQEWPLKPGPREILVHVRYPTRNGTWVISYAKGWPEGRFESK